MGMPRCKHGWMSSCLEGCEDAYRGPMCRCGHPLDCHMGETGGFCHPLGHLTTGTCLGDGPVPRSPQGVHPCGCEKPERDWSDDDRMMVEMVDEVLMDGLMEVDDVSR
jgi:hypothetical protein